MPTHFRGSEKEVRALNAYINFMRAAESVAARMQRLLPGGLTVSQFGVLETLFHLGPLCQKDIAAKILKTGGNLTMVIDNLEKQGWVERRRDGADRRFVSVHLTAAGRETVKKILPGHIAAIVREMGALAPAEQDALRDFARRLGAPRPH